MKAVVYVYLQQDLPNCFWVSLRKTREMWDGPIYVIAPRREDTYGQLAEQRVTFVAQEDMDAEFRPMLDRYEKATWFTTLYKDWNGFWDNACKRFLYLSLVQTKFNLTEIVHLETDVIVYVPLKEMFEKCNCAYRNRIVLSPHSPFQFSCCFIYCGDAAAMRKFSDAMVEYFGRGEDYFRKKYPGQTIPNETHFAFTFVQENSALAGLFPTMPGEPYHEELGFLIDSTAWGMWVGGLQRHPPPRYACRAHFIGERLLAGRYDIHFEFEGERVKMPWVYDKETGLSHRLATLHFNSKRPERWI